MAQHGGYVIRNGFREGSQVYVQDNRGYHRDNGNRRAGATLYFRCMNEGCLGQFSNSEDEDNPAPVPAANNAAPVPAANNPAPVPAANNPAPVPAANNPAPVPAANNPAPGPAANNPAPVPAANNPAPGPAPVNGAPSANAANDEPVPGPSGNDIAARLAQAVQNPAAGGRRIVVVRPRQDNPAAVDQQEERIRALQAQLLALERTYREQTNCITCFDSPRQETFYPCGHFVLCSVCYDRLVATREAGWGDRRALCPSCRQTIIRSQRTYS